MFAATKEKNLEVFVTISHSAPYDCPNKVQMTRDILGNADVDYASPQLYTSGYETVPDTGFYDGLDWAEYGDFQATNGWKFLPSIVDTSHFATTESYYDAYTVIVDGYVQWAQVAEECPDCPLQCGSCTACYVPGWGSPCMSEINEADCLAGNPWGGSTGDAIWCPNPVEDQDCEGTFSTCTAACETAAQRVFTETQAQQGNGLACPTATDCQEGQGECVAIVHQDCEGTWSTCTEACETAGQRTFTETQAQSGNGAACPTTTSCQEGEDECVTIVINEHVGYYDWTWDGQNPGPEGSDIAVSFSGWIDVQQ
eukprot:UN29169